LVRIFSATFWGGVNAAHCPIAAPKRQLQPERYAKYNPKLFEKY
jgi:hypothetical protein